MARRATRTEASGASGGARRDAGVAAAAVHPHDVTDWRTHAGPAGGGGARTGRSGRRPDLASRQGELHEAA